MHFGSLVAATASYLAARQSQGEWLVRIEDLDRPREIPGSADLILRTLDTFGFEWTGPILKQSARTEAYEEALAQLEAKALVYRCSCSRKEIAAASMSGEPSDEPRYPGLCREGPLNPGAPYAVRFRVPPGAVAFNDAIQGRITVDIERECGDFVVRRRDGLFAYQLAVVVDDAYQGITHVVRGADLLGSTPRQLLLQQALGLPTPEYAHVPLAIDPVGVKLSKSAGAGAVDTSQPATELWRALDFLLQNPPLELRATDTATVWQWAVQHWTTAALLGLRQSSVQTS